MTYNGATYNETTYNQETSRTIELSGDAVQQLLGAGDLTKTHFLTSDASSQLQSSGDITKTHILDAQANSALNTAGDLFKLQTMSGDGELAMNGAGILAVGQFTFLIGSADMDATGSGDLFKLQLITGDADTQLTADGDIQKNHLISGDADTNLTGSADLDDVYIISGDAETVMDTTGDLFKLQTMSGAATQTMTAEGAAKTLNLLEADSVMKMNGEGTELVKSKIFGAGEASMDLSARALLEVTDVDFVEFDIDKMHRRGYQNAKALLKVLVDPSDRFNQQLFYDRDPRAKSADFDGYPFILIDNYSLEPDSVTANGNVREWSFDIDFEVFSIDDGQEEFDLGDDIADQLFSFVFGEKTRFLGSEALLAQPEINRNQRFTGVDRNQQPVSRREFEMSFRLHLSPDVER